MTIRATLYRTAAFLSVIILLALTGCQSDEKQAQDYLKSAQQYYNSGEYSLASVEIRNAIKKDSSLAEPYLLQAKIFELRKEWEAMHAFLATTLQQQPNHIDANIEIAKLYVKGRNVVSAQRHLDTAVKAGASAFNQHLVQGMIDLSNQKLTAATEQADAALAIDPESIDASILTATLSLRHEKYQHALTVINKALNKHTESESLLLMKSKIYSVQGQFEQAASHAKTLATLRPKELSYHYLLAALLDTAGNKQAAEQALRDAAKANPDNSKPKIALAGYISQQDKTLAAIDLLSLYIESEPTNSNDELRLILAELYSKQGLTDQAATLYKNMLSNDKKFANTAKNKLALMAIKDNRQDDALAILNDVLVSDFSNAEALITRSIIHLADKRSNDAITDLLSALREDPKSALALTLLSRAYKQNNNNELAIQTLTKLLKLDPENKEATLQYSQLLMQTNNVSGAIASLKNHIEKAGASNRIQQNLMHAYMVGKKWAEAKQLAQTIAKTNNQPEYINYTNAIILQNTNKYVASINMLKALVEKNLYKHQALKAIAYNYRKLNKTEKGLAYLEQYSNNHPNDLFVISLLVSEYRYDQEFSQAELFLSAALKKNNDWGNGHIQLAKIYAAQAKWDDAISSAEKALSVESGEPSLDARLLLASAYEQLHNYTKAERYYRSVLKQSPTIQSAANNLALILAGDGSNVERVTEALHLAKRFEHSNQPLLIDTLGWIYYLNKNYQQAVLLLEKAVFSAPDAAIIHFHLGSALLALSETNKAIDHLETSRILAETLDNFEPKQKIIDLLNTHKKH